MLVIRMFGAFEFCVNGHGIDGLQGDRTKSILGRLLLCSGSSIQRAPLADKLWPDSTEKQARTNLRRELHTLRNRHSIFHECVCSDPLSITWKSPTSFEFDVIDFNSGYEGFKNDSNNSGRQKTGEHLLALSNGVLMPGHYGEWIENQRALINSRWLHIAEELFSAYKKNSAIQDAMRVAREITNRFPHKESAYLQIMQLHLLQGNKAMALQTYHQCATVLQADIGADPSSELKSLYNRASRNAGLKKNMNRVDENDVDNMGINCFTGREAELNSITLLAQQSGGVCGSNMVLITGVAGIGKTALVHEWIENNRKLVDYYAGSRCYEARGTYPLSPIRSWLQQKKYGQLLASVAAVDSSLIESSFLSNTERVDASKLGEETSPVTRERLFDALAASLKSKIDDEEITPAKRLFFLDDLQWCDQDTLGFLDHLFTYAGQSEILLLATVRSEAITPGSEVNAFCRKLMSRGQLQKLSLGNLSQDESKQLINASANALQKNHKGSKYLDADELCVRAGGHPLFLVEMVRSEFEKRSQSENNSEPERYFLPARVDAVIQQRISQLSEDAALIAAYASVIGTEFSFQLLEFIPDLTQESLIGAMDELWQKHIILQTDHGNYRFSHDCIREVSYQVIPAPKKQLLHSHVSNALERFYQNHTGGISSRIAFHSAEASDNARAYRWYLQAIDHAEFSLVAHKEVVEHCDTILELLERKNIDFDKDHFSRLRITLIKSSAIGILEGYASPKLQSVCEQLEKMINNVDDLMLRCCVVHRLRVYHLHANNPEKSLRYAKDQIAIVQAMSEVSTPKDTYQYNIWPARLPPPLLLVNAYLAKALAQFQLGNFDSVHRSAKLGCEVAYEAEQANSLDPKRPSHILLMLHAIGSWAYTISGLANEAKTLFEKCKLYETCTGAFSSKSNALFMIARVHLLREEVEQVDFIGERLIAMGQEKSLLKLEVMGSFFCGTAAFARGSNERAVEHLQFSVQRYTELNESLFSIEHHLWLSKIYLAMNNPDEALETINSAFEDTKVSRASPFMAEMYAQKALVLDALSKPALEVLQEFERSFKVAASQKADLVKLTVMHLEYQYRLTNDLPFILQLNNLRELHGKVAQDGSSPTIDRVGSVLAASRN